MKKLWVNILYSAYASLDWLRSRVLSAMIHATRSN